MATFIPVIGSDFSASAALPATNDAAGYGAVTFTDTGPCEIIDISGFDDEWNTVEDDTLCNDGGAALKGKLNIGAFSVTIKFDKSNAIHPILSAAFDSATDVISFAVTLINGDKYYFRGQVMKYNPVLGSAGDYVTRPVTIQPHGRFIEVAV